MLSETVSCSVLTASGFSSVHALSLAVEHDVRRGIRLQERWEQVEQLYHNNLVQAIGLRDCTVYQLQQIMASSKIVPSVVSVEIHPYHNNWDLVKFCKKQVGTQTRLICQFVTFYAAAIAAKECMTMLHIICSLILLSCCV